ncbi:hypothetical protein V6N12_022065 [Hibiscus sabdariffa]|uniref:Uncharacterized protein n=1 Tax=Hibiscus sabdariffa TaxID=183260 RepID=A0ABR2FU39_9ROSI
MSQGVVSRFYGRALLYKEADPLVSVPKEGRKGEEEEDDTNSDDVAARDSEKNALPAVPSSSQMATANSVSVSTANTNGAPAVTNLGIVGWDVKHVLTGASAVKLNGIKKPAINPPSDKGESRGAS